MMKKYLLKTAGLMALTLLLSSSGFAQDQDHDDDKDSSQAGDRDEIVIRHKNDKDAKIVIEIKGNQVYINGKPASDYSDDNISVHKQREMSGQAFGWGSDNFPGGITFAPSPFRKHGGTMNIEGDGWTTTGNKAFLGVTTGKPEKDNEGGAEIHSISKGSAASKAGLKEGDIITRIDEIKIDGPESLTAAIHKYKPEDKISLSFKRDGKEQKMSIILGKSPAASLGTLFKMPNIDYYQYRGAAPGPRAYGYSYGGARPRLGIKAQDTEDGKGVKVLEVGDESAAEKAGIQEGDIITKFDGKEINSATELAEVARESREKTSVKVSVLRDGKPQEIEIRTPKKLRTADL